MTSVLLVTGFGPFGEYQENPSGDIAERVNRRTIAGVQVVGKRVPVSWGEAWTDIHSSVLEHRPAALLCLGVAPDPFVRLEVMARNIALPSPDHFGQQPQVFELWSLVPDAPAAYWTTLPLDWLGQRVQQRREQLLARGTAEPVVHARRWPDAGYYLCNHVFFHAMHFLQETVPVRGFIHVPRYPSAEATEHIPRHEILAAGVFLVEELACWLAQQPRAQTS